MTGQSTWDENLMLISMIKKEDYNFQGEHCTPKVLFIKVQFLAF